MVRHSHPPTKLKKILFWGLYLGSVYLFLYLGIRVYRGEGFAFDAAILAYLAACQNSALDLYFGWVTWAGSGYLLTPLAIAAVAAYLVYRRYAEALLLTLGLAGASIIMRATKVVVMRERPTLFPSMVELPPDWSFPSGHAAQITAFALAVILDMRHARPHWRWLTTSILIVIVISVVMSRLYLQVHYPSDVFGGVLLALIWILTVKTFLHVLLAG